jgi:hypothetical protein
MYGLDFTRKKTWSSYNSDDPIEDFVSWLLTAFTKKFPVIIFSHNGGRFVVYFRLIYLLKTGLITTLFFAHYIAENSAQNW